MGSGRSVLRETMVATGTTQTALAQISGVRQPSISQLLAGRIEMTDSMLERLLACMGHRLEVVRSARPAELDRSHRRSWLLHRQLSSGLTPDSFPVWKPRILINLDMLRGGVRGQPHERNLERWRVLVENGDVNGLHRVMTGLDDDAVEMREVSPLQGLLDHEARAAVLQESLL